jgi:NDP-sugar pyrophosphorylase family protein
MSKRAIILAGGKGTRLKPYTVALPKPLVPIGKYPILEIIIRQLVFFGFDRATLTVNHQADIIQAYFGDGSKWGINIDYSFEDKPMNTMGPLTLINDLPENFLVMNGDVLTDLDFNGFYQDHCSRDSIFTISGYKRSIINEFGVLETNPLGNLSGFREKPRVDFTVSMGVYMVSSKVLDHIPKGESFGFDHLMLKLLDENHPVRVKEFDGYWLDIGRPDDYEMAVTEFEQNPDIFLKNED